MEACLVEGLSEAPLRLGHISEVVVDGFKSSFDGVLEFCHFHADSMMVGVSCSKMETSAASPVKR